MQLIVLLALGKKTVLLGEVKEHQRERDVKAQEFKGTDLAICKSNLWMAVSLDN